MSYDLLTTSGINSFVNTFIQSESSKRLMPLQTRKSKFSNLSTAYTTLQTKINTLKNSLSSLKTSGTSSIFRTKTAASSNTNFLTVTASNAAQPISTSIKVLQLAKNDSLISFDKDSTSAASITTPGTYSFVVKTGDGKGGTLNSSVSVVLSEADFSNGTISYASLADKLKKAINDDVAEIKSNSVTGSVSTDGTFKINLNGTETEINYSTGSYDEVIDSIVSQLNASGGVVAEKITDANGTQLKVRAKDSSKYISLSGDTSSLLTELGITSEKEIAASKAVSVSVFAPTSGFTQLSLTAKNSGEQNRIMEIADGSANGILNEFGLNLGTSRTSFVQDPNGLDTAGFLHQLSSLNSKLTYNGIEIQRNSNSISDLVEGVTLTLKGIMGATDPDVSITVENDTKAVKTKIEEFVTAFNDVYKYIRTNSTSTTDKRGLLIGDSSASSLQNILINMGISRSSLTTSELTSLSQMGITFNSNTGLSISDSTQLEKVILNQTDSIESFFNSESGFASRFYSLLDPYTGASGYLAKAITRQSDNISRITDSISGVETQINKRAEALRRQYQQLQMQLVDLLSTQNLFGGGA